MLLRTVSSDRAVHDIEQLRYYATEPDEFGREADEEAVLSQIVANAIKTELDNELGDAGVLSLSATWDSALMWSHYADEHRGICIEYDTRDQGHPRLEKVNYKAARAVKASDLWLWKAKGDEAAKRRVFDTYYYSKSWEWHYEKEWRDVSENNGVRSLPFQITAVLFGLRCDPSVIKSMVKLLAGYPQIKLWQMLPKNDSFELRRQIVNRDEIEQSGIRQPSFLLFKDIIWDDDFEKVDELDPPDLPADWVSGS